MHNSFACMGDYHLLEDQPWYAMLYDRKFRAKLEPWCKKVLNKTQTPRTKYWGLCNKIFLNQFNCFCIEWPWIFQLLPSKLMKSPQAKQIIKNGYVTSYQIWQSIGSSRLKWDPIIVLNQRHLLSMKDLNRSPSIQLSQVLVHKCRVLHEMLQLIATVLHYSTRN